MLLINLPENQLLEERSRGCGRRGTQQIPSVDVTLSYSCQWTEEFRMDGGGEAKGSLQQFSELLCGLRLYFPPCLRACCCRENAVTGRNSSLFS